LKRPKQTVEPNPEVQAQVQSPLEQILFQSPAEQTHVQDSIKTLTEKLVSQIKETSTKTFDPETPMGLVRIIYNRINPKVSFPIWVSKILGTTTEKNLEKDYWSDIKSQTKIKSMLKMLQKSD
jgi:hypothetical protein